MKAGDSARWKTAGKCRRAGILLLISVATALGVPADPVVVVIDSGMDSGHAVFEGRLLGREAVVSGLPEPLRPGDGKFWPGWDFVDNDANPQDGTGHGTHVAGLVAKGLEAEKAQGKVVMFRTGDRQHQLAPVTAALEMVAALRKKGWDIPVLLCAFDYRTKPENGEGNERFKQSIQALTNAGVICVCAAGNSGNNIDGKAADPQFQVALRHPAMITVAACTGDGQLLAASNYGAVSVALAAPGFGVESAAREGGMAALSGSSQAAAVVAGQLAAHAITSKERDPKVLRAWLLKQVRVHPSLVGRVESAGFLPMPEAKAKAPE
ncbi:MAG: S8 family serine peptidase [Verrucomicrobia bacterium]|nr:S8 family serine peptidase [Verrucomicrobiota bacterium]